MTYPDVNINVVIINIILTFDDKLIINPPFGIFGDQLRMFMDQSMF